MGWKISFLYKLVIFSVYINLPEGNFPGPIEMSKFCADFSRDRPILPKKKHVFLPGDKTTFLAPYNGGVLPMNGMNYDKKKNDYNMSCWGPWWLITQSTRLKTGVCPQDCIWLGKSCRDPVGLHDIDNGWYWGNHQIALPSGNFT